MKPFNIDIESADASSYAAGMVRVIAQVTVTEDSTPDKEFSELHLAEKTARRLHEMLGNIIRNLDEYEASKRT